MTDYTAPNFRYPARSWSLHAGQSLSEPTEADEAVKLSGGTRIIVALFLSFGLWGALWLGISPLVEAWLR